MANLLTPQLSPKLAFLRDELHRQGFTVGISDVLKVNRFFETLWDNPLSINDLKGQLAALVCQNPLQQKAFYEWFDKWSRVIERQTQSLLAQLEPDETASLTDKKDAQNTAETPKTDTENTKTEPPKNGQTQTNSADKRSFPVSQKERTGPIFTQLAFPQNLDSSGKAIRFWNLAELETVLPILREKKWVESTEWDIPATIRRTILWGGIPQFVSKPKRQTPQYLVLIEQQNHRDHLANFYAELADELSRRDLTVSVFYYDTTPAICWRERNNPRSQMPLEQLQGEFSGARLFIFGNVETLLKQPYLEPSAVALSILETWHETAVFPSRSTAEWGRAELAIGQLFPVVPASGLGFKSLMPQWAGFEHFTPAYWQMNSREPRTPDVANFVETYVKNEGNTEGVVSKKLSPEDERQLNDLYFYLKDGGYRWLGATALYPELYYELTRLYADEVITKNLKLSEWEQNRRWWEAMRLLVRLDWFRKGNMPTYWRRLLRDDFSVEKAVAMGVPEFEVSVKAARAQLLQVLKLTNERQLIPKDSYAEANQTFTKVWLETEIENKLTELPQKMTDLEISMGDIDDSVGQQIWYATSEKAAQDSRFSKAKTLYAVIVGIDNYPTLSPLLGCVADATAMSQYLQEYCGAEGLVYSEKKLLGEAAKRENIIDGFDHFQEANNGDVCVFYFAGRGAQQPAPPEFWDETDGLSEILLCWDNRESNSDWRDLAAKELGFLIYKATKYKDLHFLAITDACHSGADNTPIKSKAASAKPFGKMVAASEYLGFSEYVNYQPPTSKHIHFAACQSNETSNETLVDGKTRGAFTVSLLETLAQAKSKIDYADLKTQVQKKVVAKVKNQNPQLNLYGDWGKSVPFLGMPLPQKIDSETKPILRKEVRVACVSQITVPSWIKFVQLRADLLSNALIKPVDVAANPDFVINTEGGLIFIAEPRVPARPLIEMVDNKESDRAYMMLIEQLNHITRWNFVKSQSTMAESIIHDWLRVTFEHDGKIDDLKDVKKATYKIADYKTQEPQELYVSGGSVTIAIANIHPTNTMYIAGIFLSEFFGIDTTVINQTSVAMPLEPGKTFYIYGKSFRFSFRDNIFEDKWDKLSNFLKIYTSSNPFDLTHLQQSDLERPRKPARREERTYNAAISDQPNDASSIPEWFIKTIEFELDISSLTDKAAIDANKSPKANQISEKVQQLVAEAKLEEALTIFESWANTDGVTDIKNTIILLKSQYATLKKNIQLGIISNEEAQLETAKITNALVYLLPKEEGESDSSYGKKAPNQAKRKK